MSKIKTLALAVITSLVLIILGVGSISSQAQYSTKKYVDNEFGVTLDYPYDWSIANTINNPQNIDPFTIQKRITLSNNSNLLTSFNVDVWRNFEGLSTQDWFNKYERRFHTSTSHLINGKDITISNVPALLIFEEAQNDAHGRITILLSTQDLVVRLDYYTNEGGLFQSEFVDIAKSITFIHQQPMVNIQGIATNFPNAPFMGVNNATLQVATCCGWVDPNLNTYPCSGGNCTWWSKYKRPDVGNNWGNAGDWRDRARQAGFSVGYTAQVGAIAVWQPSVDTGGGWYAGSVGHVAYVESVESNGWFWVSSMSWGGACTTGNSGVSTLHAHESGDETLTFIYADTAYQGEFVGQTFQGTMMADTIQHAQVQIKNTGTQAWDSNTKISALPLDQANPFYDPSWLHPYRIASSGVVQPGAVGTFDFILHAPLTAGQYRINFAFVQEGISWFTNPAASAVWYPITVTPINVIDSYQGTFVSQNYQDVMVAGLTQQVQIQLRNSGTATWNENTRLVALPRDGVTAPFSDTSWIGGNRIVSAGSVPPGSLGTFNFVIHAPTIPGDYQIEFALVQEGVTWFTEPADGSINFALRVMAPVSAVASTNHIAVFQYQADLRTAYCTSDASGGTAWAMIGGETDHAVAGLIANQNTIETFVLGMDSALWHRQWDGSTWNAWENLGGSLQWAPVVTSLGPDRTDVFAYGRDNDLYHRVRNGSTWDAWENIGGTTSFPPVAVAWGNTHIGVFVRGEDGALWHRRLDGTVWQAWENLGGSFQWAPIVTASGPDRIDVVAYGTDNDLHHRAWNGTAWEAWENIGGTTSFPPTAISWGPNHLEVFARGEDGTLWHRRWDGTTWQAWESLGGTVVGSPVATSWGHDRIGVFVRGMDGLVYIRAWDGTQWQPWTMACTTALVPVETPVTPTPVTPTPVTPTPVTPTPVPTRYSVWLPIVQQ